MEDLALSIVDVENPEQPRYNQEYNANGAINDTNDLKIGMVAGSAFAFVADGRNGLRVLQIVSPWDDPAHFSGFSPRPTPKLIATARTSGPVLAISKGIGRDRAVDESGNQRRVRPPRRPSPKSRRNAAPLPTLHQRCVLFRHRRTCRILPIGYQFILMVLLCPCPQLAPFSLLRFAHESSQISRLDSQSHLLRFLRSVLHQSAPRPGAATESLGTPAFLQRPAPAARYHHG
jgi:hypothetical protein